MPCWASHTNTQRLTAVVSSCVHMILYPNIGHRCWCRYLSSKKYKPVLRIRDVYPGSRILIFTHPGSRMDLGSRIRIRNTVISDSLFFVTSVVANSLCAAGRENGWSVITDIMPSHWTSVADPWHIVHWPSRLHRLDNRRIRFRIRTSLVLTNGSGSGGEAQKHTDPDPQHCI